MTETPTLLARAKAFDPNRAIRIKRAHDYPEHIWFLLASFVAFLTLCHIGALVVFWQRKRRARRTAPPSDADKGASNEEPVTPNASGKISLRRVPLAIVNSFRILLYRITLPIGGGHILNGAEIGITVGYIIALFTWEFINCTNVTTGAMLDIKYWSNRAGTIVMSQLPLMVALAGKNNIITLLTGISYEKLNVLHRAAARVCLVLVWVHFWGRVKQGLIGDDSIHLSWVRTGITNATAYTTLVLISFRPLRTKFYEFFFFSHCILVLMILIGSYFHIRRGFGPTSSMRHDYGPYLIPAFTLWALDRTLRLLRTIRNNPSLFRTSRTSDATVELLSPTMVRLVLTRNMSWRAGQSAFITVPGVSRVPFEAHPFTIASIPRDDSATPTETASSEEEGAKDTARKGGNELILLVGVKEGFTKRLREAAGREGGEETRFPLSVYVDGPYGSPPDVNAFTSVILVAGGSGVSYALPLLQDIVQNARKGTTACQGVFFLWAVPHRENLSWISRALHDALEAAPPSLQIRVRMHVTRDTDAGTEKSSSDSKEPTDTTSEKLLQNDSVSVENGRPNVQALLEEELLSAKGPVSVDVAGPSTLAADVRKALRSRIVGPGAALKGGPDVTLHVETYGIA